MLENTTPDPQARPSEAFLAEEVSRWPAQGHLEGRKHAIFLGKLRLSRL